MKKFLTIGALSLALAAVCSAPAPAWLNWKWGLGINGSWQSGGNNTMWGLFRNGQPPAPDCGGGCPLPAGPIGGPMGGPIGPGGFGFAPNSTGPDAAPTRATPQSFPTNQQSSWSNYYSNVGYRYPSYPYGNSYSNYGYYGYGAGYSR